MSNPEVQPTRRNTTMNKKWQPRLKDLTSEQQETVRKQWREKYLQVRDKKKQQYANMDPRVKHEKSEETRRNRYEH